MLTISCIQMRSISIANNMPFSQYPLSYNKRCDLNNAHRFIRGYCVYLSAKHDTSEQREQETFKHSKQSQDERQRAGYESITTLEILSNTTKEKPCHHSQTKQRHRHDVELHGSVGVVRRMVNLIQYTRGTTPHHSTTFNKSLSKVK